MNTEIVTAETGHLPQIMEIIHSAQEYLNAQGLDQWQNGYPSEEVICEDIKSKNGYCAIADGKVTAYGALVFGQDESYEAIENGLWVQQGEYAAFHRIAAARAHRKAGLAKMLITRFEEICVQNKIYVMRADTHPGNMPMQSFLEKGGYQKRGIIHLVPSGEVRFGYDKLLK